MAKGKVSFEQDLCKGCALCVAACPLKIVELDKSMINKKAAVCNKTTAFLFFSM